MQEDSNILMADDDPNFVLLLRTAFEYAGFRGRIAAVGDGLEAVRYLQGEGRFADRRRFPEPSLILLDLRLPRWSGFDVLRWIRSQPKWSELPVVVLTGTYIEAESEKAAAEGASVFLIKPFDFVALTAMAERIAETWLPQPHLSPR